MTFDSLSKLQQLVDKERVKALKKFQRKYKTKVQREEFLKAMDNNDINFLIYCTDTIYGKMYLSKFLKK